MSGDFNSQEGEKCLYTFLHKHELKSLNKEDTVTETQISQFAMIIYWQTVLVAF